MSFTCYAKTGNMSTDVNGIPRTTYFLFMPHVSLKKSLCWAASLGVGNYVQFGGNISLCSLNEQLLCITTNRTFCKFALKTYGI